MFSLHPDCASLVCNQLDIKSIVNAGRTSKHQNELFEHIARTMRIPCLISLINSKYNGYNVTTINIKLGSESKIPNFKYQWQPNCTINVTYIGMSLCILNMRKLPRNKSSHMTEMFHYDNGFDTPVIITSISKDAFLGSLMDNLSLTHLRSSVKVNVVSPVCVIIGSDRLCQHKATDSCLIVYNNSHNQAEPIRCLSCLKRLDGNFKIHNIGPNNMNPVCAWCSIECKLAYLK